MNNRSLVLIVSIVALLILIITGTYTVREGQRAIVLRLGELVMNSKTHEPKVMLPGLHFKLPFITTVRKLDVRLQTLDVESSRILTSEQKYLIVDYFVKWRINNVALYYKRTGGYSFRAETLLQQKTNNALRAAFGERSIKEVVSDDRLNVMSLLKQKANRSASSLGIEVVDVRIKGIDLPKAVRESVFQQMRIKRKKVATRHRSQGKAQAEAIRATADAEVAVSLAKAQAEAQKIRADGDAKSARIYIDAYRKNASFYAFYRSLMAYNHVFKNKSTVMVIKPNGQFFKYFNQSAVKKNLE